MKAEELREKLGDWTDDNHFEEYDGAHYTTISLPCDVLDELTINVQRLMNQRVIEELENVFHNSNYATDIALHHRLQELKQELKTK